jgi:DNA-binding response OmpR family regulator/DNA-binding ferritin-like protein (Dps family)
MYKKLELISYAKRQKILYVDDDRELSRITINILKEFFGEVVTAYDGLEGLEKFKNDRFDIVLTDLHTSGINGIELTQAIKAINYDKAVIVLSSFDENDELVELINLGVDGFLKKPFEAQTFFDLILKVSRHISKKKEDEKHRIKTLIRVITQAQRHEPESATEQEITQALIETPNESLEEEEKCIKNYLKNMTEESNDLYLELKYAIEDLIEINHDFGDEIDLLHLKNDTSNVIHRISELINRYYSTLSSITGFVEVAQTLNEFSQALSQLNIESLSEDQIDALDMLEFVQSDISSFIDNIFVTQSVDNIEYFKDSLKSSIDDILVKVGVKEEESGDIDFF